MKYKNVWTNGCFDILHIGHIELLNYAKSIGEKLIVGIDSDERIKNNKSPNRPINNWIDRLNFLKNIRSVDKVVVFNSDSELENYLRFFQIDAIVIGDDYKNSRVVGSDIVKNILFFPKIKNKSSSLILSKL